MVAHFVGGSGAVQVARTLDDRADLKGMVHALRDELRPADTTFEVLTEDVLPTPPTQQAEPPTKDGPADPADPTAKAELDPQAKPKPKEKPPEAKPKAPAAEVAKAAPKPPPEPEAKPTPEVAVQAKPVQAPPPPPPDNRIAVRQHAEKDQPDNPEAARIADDANHVKEESVAKIRSHDQDDADPAMGGRIKAGPRGEEGTAIAPRSPTARITRETRRTRPARRTRRARRRRTPTRRPPLRRHRHRPSPRAPRRAPRRSHSRWRREDRCGRAAGGSASFPGRRRPRVPRGHLGGQGRLHARSRESRR